MIALRIDRRLAFRLALAFGISASAVGTPLSAIGAEEKVLEPLDGKQLFERRWTAHDERSPAGDGLGPMHNATSCAACHHLGGVGGAGGREHNVELLSVQPLEASKAGRLEKGLARLHPGFGNAESTELRPNLVLHRFAPEGDYYDFRARLLGIEDPRADVDPARRAVLAASLAKRNRKQSGAVRKLEHEGGLTLLLSERNTPALWGAGLVDSISTGAINEMEKTQRRDFPAIAGRAPRVAGKERVAGHEGRCAMCAILEPTIEVGRFGWRGQTASLREFVINACANELGLQTKAHRQPDNPLAPHYRNTGSDLSDADVDALVSFVARLPPPIEIAPSGEFAAEAVAIGERAFERVGCAVCHPRKMDHIDGLFSDMLLHDMGEDFADPVEPNPEIGLVERPSLGYAGFGKTIVSHDDDPTLSRQWRTPALWGVRDSAPYMHDGRAKTLAEAIAAHAGQAADSAAKFRELSSNERAKLIAFLETLASPGGGRGTKIAEGKWR